MAQSSATPFSRSTEHVEPAAEVHYSVALLKNVLAGEVPRDAAPDLDAIVRYRISRSATLEDSATCLLLLLAGGYSVWDDGRLYEIRVLVATINRLKISIYPREHAPAHFHVVAPGINASFAITDCRLLDGGIPTRERRLVEYWHASARPTLITVWNATRPTDCPVGPIDV